MCVVCTCVCVYVCVYVCVCVCIVVRQFSKWAAPFSAQWTLNKGFILLIYLMVFG